MGRNILGGGAVCGLVGVRTCIVTGGMRPREEVFDDSRGAGMVDMETLRNFGEREQMARII